MNIHRLYGILKKIGKIFMIIMKVVLFVSIAILLYYSKHGGNSKVYMYSFITFALVGLIYLYFLGIRALISFSRKFPILAKYNPLAWLMILITIALAVSIFSNNDEIEVNGRHNNINYHVGKYTYSIIRSNEKITVEKINYSTCRKAPCPAIYKSEIKFSKDNMQLVYELFDNTFAGNSHYSYTLVYDELDDNQKLIIDSLINNDESILINYRKDS